MIINDPKNNSFKFFDSTYFFISSCFLILLVSYSLFKFMDLKNEQKAPKGSKVNWFTVWNPDTRKNVTYSMHENSRISFLDQKKVAIFLELKTYKFYYY